jgi:hypothetical protein
VGVSRLADNSPASLELEIREVRWATFFSDILQAAR